MRQSTLPQRKSYIKRGKPPRRSTKPLRKRSKLSKHKAQKNSKYWRNKADAEFSRIFAGKPCIVCGTTKSTCGHHLIPKGRCAEHRHTLMNGIPLCPTHHTMGNDMAAHSQSSLVVAKFVLWFKEHYLRRMEWYIEHQFDNGKPDYRAAYERLQLEKGGRG